MTPRSKHAEMLVVGKDVDGSWTVREGAGFLLGRFASSGAAHRFAEREQRCRTSLSVASSDGTRPRLKERLTSPTGMRRSPHRLAGLALLLASGGATLVHRAIFEAARHGPAQASEFAIGMLTFVLASAGMLLVIHGAKVLGDVGPPSPGKHVTSGSKRDRRLARTVLRDDEAPDTRPRRAPDATRAGRCRTGPASVSHSTAGTDRN